MCRKESLGLRRPLKSAIAAVLAVAMLVPTASAAPSVVLPNGTDGNAPAIAAADLVGNAEPEGIVDSSTIIISNYRQLTAIGTGVPVTDGDAAEDTFGTGRTISDEAGSPLTYALDATYRLAGTISMPQNGVWQLPADSLARSKPRRSWPIRGCTTSRPIRCTCTTCTSWRCWRSPTPPTSR